MLLNVLLQRRLVAISGLFVCLMTALSAEMYVFTVCVRKLFYGFLVVVAYEGACSQQCFLFVSFCTFFYFKTNLAQFYFS